MVFWTSWSFSRYYIKVHILTVVQSSCNCHLQNIACGIGAVFLPIDMVVLLMDMENVGFTKNVSKL